MTVYLATTELLQRALDPLDPHSRQSEQIRSYNKPLDYGLSYLL